MTEIFNLEENYGDNTVIEMHRTPPSAKRQAPTSQVSSGELAQAVMESQLLAGNDHNDLQTAPLRNIILGIRELRKESYV